MTERERSEEWHANTAPVKSMADARIPWKARAEIAENRVKKLEEALRFYADNRHVERRHNRDIEHITVEDGQIARKALGDKDD